MTTQNTGTIVYNVDVNTAGFIRGMDQVNNRLGAMGGEMSRADQRATALGGGLNKLTAAFAALAAVKSLQALQSMSEEFTLLRERVDRFSGGVREGADNYERLLAISSKTGADMGTAVKTWESLSGTLHEMGKSNADILTLTDTLMKMGSLGGASAEEMKNGLRQLGQSFAGGIVRGEEFNSVLENTPEIGRQLAKGLGVPFASLRGLMLDSKLTADVVFDALLKRTDSVSADFDKMSRKVSQASNALTNEFGSALAKLDKESGFSANLAAAIDIVATKIHAFGSDAQSVADAYDLISGAASSFAAVMAGRVLTSLYGTATAQLAAIKATTAAVEANRIAAAAELQKAEAAKMTTVAQLESARAAVTSAEASVAASRQVQAAEIARMQTVVAALQSEKALETQRLKAQITDQGRAATIARMAELQLSLTAVTGQLTAAQATLSATTVSTSAAMTQALLARTAATDATAAASLRVAAATTAMGTAAASTSVIMRALGGAMSFLGGPVGVILLAAYALYEFSKAANKTKVDVDALNGSLDKLTFNQLSKASNDAGDDITKLNKKLSSSMSELRTASKSVFESDTDFAKRKVELLAEKDGIELQIKARQDLQSAIKKQQDQLALDQVNKANTGSVKPVHKTAAVDQTVIDNLKEQRALAGLAGEARARLAAEQKLSAGATAEEKKAVGDLAVEIYKLDTAKKEAKKDDRADESARKKALADEKSHTEENTKAITDYAVSIGQAAMKGEDLARSQAQAKLNKFATPEDVATMDALAKAMHKVQEAENNKQKLASVDPMAAEGQGFTDELTKLQELNDAKLLSDERYLELKAQATTAHEAQMRLLQEENFAAASAGNAILLSSIDALGASAAQSLSGILSGTSNLKEALSGIANTVFNTVIGSFTQMGTEWVKQEIIKRAATKATEAAQVAGIGTLATTQAAATGAIAATTTTTAATTGTAVATSMAPAAGLSSIASFGSAAVIGGAALLGTMALAKSFGGGRQYGGGVDGSKMYQVNETGKPEIFNAANGKQYMMPNQRGEVVSNNDATSGGGAGGGTTVNIHNYSGAEVTSSESQIDDKRVIDIVVGNMANGGQIAQMTNKITGTQRRGT